MKWIGLGVFGSVGLIALFISAWASWGSVQLVTQGIAVPGEVVELESGGDTTYPVYEYTDVNGVEHRRRGEIGTSPPHYQVAQKVEILYLEDTPHEGFINDFSEMWTGALVGGIFGSMFLGGGIAMFFFVRSSEAAFGPEFHEAIDRARRESLRASADAVRLDAIIVRVEDRADDWLLVCERAGRTFEAEVALNPGDVVGETVEVFVHTTDKERYLVEVGPVIERAL